MKRAAPAWASWLSRAYDWRLGRKFGRLYAAEPDPYRYDASSFERERRERMVALLGPSPAGKVLEVGCAGGFVTEALARSFGAVDAVDIAQGALDAASARLEKAGLGERAKFRRASLVGLAPEPGAYDAILAAEVLYYLGGRNAFMRALGADRALLDDALRTLLGALKPGGRLLLAHSYPAGERTSREIYARRAEALGGRPAAEETLRSEAEDRTCLLSLLTRPA